MTDHDDKYLHTASDGIPRCWWGANDEDYQRYHDEEWGRPVADDLRLFEKICLEGFQSGLSWLTILRKRDNFRDAFAEFDFHKVARFRDRDVARLLWNEGIVRHRGKIEATIGNARRALEIVREFGSLGAYIWQWEPDSPEPHAGKGDNPYPIPSITKTSQALSKDLKNRGWKFFGPTTAYAFMQAMGLVNDHVEGCAIRTKVDVLRRKFNRPQKKHTRWCALRTRNRK
jgi:DNA-3-methyladenine glycosylase I